MSSLPLHHTHGSADTLSLHSYYSGFILSYTLGPRAKQPAAMYAAAQRRHFEQPSLFTTLLFFSLRCSKTLLCFTQIQPVICSTLPHLSPLEMHQTSVPHLLLEVRSEKEERELSCQHEVLHILGHSPMATFKSRGAHGGSQPLPPRWGSLRKVEGQRVLLGEAKL